MHQRFTGSRNQWLLLLGAATLAIAIALAVNAITDKRETQQRAAAAVDAHLAAEAEKRATAQLYLQDIQTLQPLVAAWDEQLRIASSTPRAFLAPRIDQLNAVIASVQSARMHSTCTREAKSILLASLKLRKEELIAFLGQQSSTVAAQKATAQEDRFREHFSACAPDH